MCKGRQLAVIVYIATKGKLLPEWPCTSEIPLVDLEHSDPGSYKQNRGQKGRRQSTQTIQLCTTITDTQKGSTCVSVSRGGGSPYTRHTRMCHLTGIIWFGEKLPYIRVHISNFALQKGPFFAPKVPYKRVLFC